MGPFDAVCHSFATMATGGFSNHNASVGGYASPAVEWIIIVFMFLAGANFSLHYLALTGRWQVYARGRGVPLLPVDHPASAPLLIGGVLLANHFYPQLARTLRHTLFQVVSILTTTGFGTADYLLWPPVAHALLLILMAVGRLRRIHRRRHQGDAGASSCCEHAKLELQEDAASARRVYPVVQQPGPVAGAADQRSGLFPALHGGVHCGRR